MDMEQQGRLMLVRLFSLRLNQALERKDAIPRQGRGRIEAAALLLGTSISTTQRMLSGVALPEAHRLVQIADKLDVSIDYLMGRSSLEESDRLLRQRAGKEAVIPEGEYLAIPFLNPDDTPDAERIIYAGRSRIARFIQPVESAAMIRMRGESMAPTILDGEMMLIAYMPYAGDSVLPEGLYPMQNRERSGWTVRRIQPVAGGMYSVMCDNTHYPEVKVPHQALAMNGDYEWAICGRLRTVHKRY